MKLTCWPGTVFCVVGFLSLLSGCSKATSEISANQVEEQEEAVVYVAPEWAREEPTAAPVKVAMKVQPIPELADEPTSEPTDLTNKPFPEDE